jgi:hypothetical protein
VLEPESRESRAEAERITRTSPAAFEIRFHFFWDRCSSQAKFRTPGNCSKLSCQHGKMRKVS